MSNIILASASPYRQEILRKLGIKFVATAANIDESRREGEGVAMLVERLARQKALAVFAGRNDFVIGSDQMAVAADGTILGKPKTIEKACEQLTLCSGSQVMFYTGIALKRGREIASKIEKFSVHFRKLSESEINAYIAKEQPLDCAGSFKSEGLGILLFSVLEGRDPNALVGLPLIALNELFMQFNVNLLTDKVGE